MLEADRQYSEKNKTKQGEGGQEGMAVARASLRR